jgi:HEAT repeat protein
MTQKKRNTRTASRPLVQPKEQYRAEDVTASPESFMDALSSHNDAERLKARHSLVALGKAALPPLIRALQSKHDLTRWEAVKSLTEIGDPESAPALIKTLADEEFDIRWLAAVGLIGMNLRALKPLLQALMDQRDSHLMREGAHHVIHDLAKGELRRYLVPVLAALDGVDPATEVPGVAFRALEMLERDHKL